MKQLEGTLGWKRFKIFGALAFCLATSSSQAFSEQFGGDFLPWRTVKGFDGNFYGSVLEGGIPGGLVYSLTPEGMLERAKRFPPVRYASKPSGFGSNPEGTLGVGQDGAIYGSTRSGGVFGSGVIFKLDSDGAYTTLHSFETVPAYKGPLTVAQNGDVFASFQGDPSGGVVRLSKDGSHTVIPMTPWITALIEDSNHQIVLGSIERQVGRLWRLNAQDQFEPLADVGYYPHHLTPLADGGLLCLTTDRLVKVSSTGTVTIVHEFNLAFEGLGPNFIVVAKDGSYIGSTSTGGLENRGTVFQIVPETSAFTLLSHLPAPGVRGAGVKWMQHVFPLRVAAESGNLPPMAKDDVVGAARLKSPAGGLPQTVIPVLANDADADEDLLSIHSVSNPEHGVATVDSTAQNILYTANSPDVENDAFTYKVIDGNGGASTAHVFIRTNVAGKYSGDVSSPESSTTGDPGTKVGSLSVVLSRNRDAVCRLELLGRNYRFSGRFNEVNQLSAVLASNRRTSTGIQLWLRADGSGWRVEATIHKNGLPFSATCAANAN